MGKKKTVYMTNLRVTFPLDQKDKEGDGSGTVPRHLTVSTVLMIVIMVDTDTI